MKEIIVSGCMGAVLAVAGIHWYEWQFWAVVGTYLVSSFVLSIHN